MIFDDASSRKVSFHTLGCKLNFCETSTLARHFTQGGYRRVQSAAEADICIINTCSVTAVADRKCRGLIRKIARENPSAIIAVTGCYAQLKPDDVASIEGVDIVLGNSAKGELFEHVASLQGKGKAGTCGCGAGELTGFFAAFSGGDRTRAFLKVQDGCDYHCTYCTIPYARGASRNISVGEAVAQARQIAAAGQKEIVITGINTGDFGRTTGENFLTLLRELDQVEGIERYRISSIEPNLLSDGVIAFTAGSRKFQPHFHVPLQSGSDRILKMMHRRYTTGFFEQKIREVRSAIPDVFIGIDLIAGFPGETDADFDETLGLLRRIAPSYLHVFPYSERPGTPAIAMQDKVPHEVSASRVVAINELCDKLRRDFYDSQIGKTAQVLFESTRRAGMMSGFTGNYVRVEAPYDSARVNRLCNVEMCGRAENGNIIGRIIE